MDTCTSYRIADEVLSMNNKHEGILRGSDYMQSETSVSAKSDKIWGLNSKKAKNIKNLIASGWCGSNNKQLLIAHFRVFDHSYEVWVVLKDRNSKKYPFHDKIDKAPI